jgi:hypothetical protein
MKTIDRFILVILAVGVWVIIILQLVTPIKTMAIDIDASDISGLEYFIEDVVEDCQVYGEVSIHDEYSGEIDGGYISC